MVIKNKHKLNIHNFIIALFSIMPLIDSLNGFVIKANINTLGSIGQIYRLSLLVVLFLAAGKRLIRRLFDITIALLVYFFIAGIIHIISGSSTEFNVEMSQVYIWGLFPLLVMTMLSLKKRGKITNTDILTCIRNITVIAPLTILIPKILGIGYTTYSSGSGFKAFYYATNGISFVLGVAVIYEMYGLCIDINIKNVIKVVMLMISCVLVGTQACFLSIGIAVILGIYFAFKNNLKKGLRTLLIVVPGIIVTASVILLRYKEEIQKLIDRRNYFKNINMYDSSVDYLTSGRLVKLRQLGYLFGKKNFFLNLLVGQGRQSEIAEMDLVDYWFQYGIFGIVLLVFFLVVIFQTIDKYDISTKWIIIFSLAYSFIVGHVFNNAMSSMMLVLFVCNVDIRKKLYFNYNKYVTKTRNKINVREGL